MEYKYKLLCQFSFGKGRGRAEQEILTHGKKVPVIRYSILAEGGGEEKTKLVPQTHGVELCVYIQY